MAQENEKPVNQETGKILQFKGLVFSGKLLTQNTNWMSAKQDLKERETNFFLSRMNGRSALSEQNVQMSSESSYYKAKFRQGADLMPRKFFFINANYEEGSADVVQACSSNEVDSKPPYHDIFIEGLVDSDCLFRTVISKNIVPFGIDSPFLVHLPVLKNGDLWSVASPSELAKNDLRNSADWFLKCDKLYAKKASVAEGKLFETLNYNNKLLVQNPSAKRLVVFNAAGTNVSAAVIENKARFWADQRTYWYCPSTENEADYLAAILNAPSLNSIIKPFQSVGLAGERDIHKKILELIPKFQNSDSTMLELSELGSRAKKSATKALSEMSQKGIVSKRKFIRTHLNELLTQIDIAVKKLL